MNKEEMNARIDLIADLQRAKIVGDPVRAFEYQLAEREARLYKESNYTIDTPSSIKCWAEAKGWTDQEACVDILAEADTFNSVLNYIRVLRLKNKYLIVASNTPEEARSIFDSTINALKAINLN